MRDYGRLLGTYGVGYVVLSPGAVTANAIAEVGGGDRIPVVSKDGDQLIPLRESLPRAYAVHRARSVPQCAGSQD